MKFICYSGCSTCKKANKWLEQQNMEFETRDIKAENPSYQELENWYKKSGLDLKRFFNTSGKSYRDLNLKEKLPEMSDTEKLKLLATDGMLVKRPILVNDDTVLVGFKEKEWEEALLSQKNE